MFLFFNDISKYILKKKLSKSVLLLRNKTFLDLNNKEYYLDIMRRFYEAIREKRIYSKINHGNISQ